MSPDRTRLRRSLFVPALHALILAACGPAAAPQASVPLLDATATQEVAADAAVTCPEEDFTAFLERFVGSPQVQRASSTDPLIMELVDADAQPEPATVSRDVPLLEVEFPVMASMAEQQAQGLQRLTNAPDAESREVTIRVPDSGVQMRYRFEARPCWTLVRVSDDTF